MKTETAHELIWLVFSESNDFALTLCVLGFFFGKLLVLLRLCHFALQLYLSPSAASCQASFCITHFYFAYQMKPAND